MPLTGRPLSRSTPRTVNKVNRLFKKKPTIAVGAAAKKLNLPKSTTHHIKQNILGYKGRKRVAVPKYRPGQEDRAKSGCRHVYEKQIRKYLVIDDETYVLADPTQTPGVYYFHAINPQEVPYQLRTKPKEKFTKKYLIWQALSEDGAVSRAYIKEGSINAREYLRECVKCRLIPFIKQHYNAADVIFWPDLATVHYAKIVQDALNDQGIECIKKEKNPPNVPQARGIELFWAHCKREYAKQNKQPETLAGFRRVWNKISAEVAKKSGKAIMEHAKKNLRKISRGGVSAVVD